ncbi:MAG: transposase [Candidatus Uhrbacteria bacterium]|nr:transposase [Patescibacteria group bacterium]MBU1906957.1 transposase [Patescibacteria group bacterium]
MSRPLRIQYPGALYHVTMRGNRKKVIFFEDSDRDLFLNILATVNKTHNWICHAYCLMDNHYHLLVETPDGNLSAGMRDLNGIYTQAHNKKHGIVGRLFQGRFKSFVIEKELYLLEVARYIVLNPVRAHIVKDPKDYKWSSHRSTAYQKQDSKCLTTDWILRFFSKQKNEAQSEYRGFVLAGIGAENPFNEVREGIILGSPQFHDYIWNTTEDTVDLKEIPRSERIINRPALEDIFDKISNNRERDRAIKFARFRCGYSICGIADHLKLSSSCISQIARDIRKK